MITLSTSADIIQQFEKGAITNQISSIEAILKGRDRAACEKVFPELGISTNLLDAALVLKKVTGQVNVLIHAIGILTLLPHILRADETIESLSLGAGNTGRLFDLETNYRIAEFKFIHWRGGAEAIRQNSLFKDFFLMAEHATNKEKYLYVLGLEHPLHFLRGGRALSSVMSRNNKLWADYQRRYGNRYKTVCEYYEQRKSEVKLVDLTEFLPQFTGSDDPREENEGI
jgi:hypothetical protein